MLRHELSHNASPLPFNVGLIGMVSDIFDDDHNGEVDFREFIQGLSHFSAKGDMESKLRFAFR